jgi:ABC-2 type transport system ATP-binding protein
VRVDRVDALRNLAVHEVELRFTEPVPAAEFERIAGVTKLVVEDHVLRMHVSGPIGPVVKAAARFELADFVSREPSLEETFLAEYGHEPVEVAGHIS